MVDGVFWLRILGQRPDGLLVVENMPEMGKKNIGVPRSASIERDLVHPFVRWQDTSRFHAHSAHCILVTQDPKTRKGIHVAEVKKRMPNTFSYLRTFEGELRKRSGFKKYFDTSKDPFYSVYNVNEQSFSDVKVVWKTMGSRIEAAVLTPISHPILGPKVPFHKNTVMFVALDDRLEAHYLVAMLNTSIVTFAAKSYSVSGGKGFGASSLLEHVAIPRFESSNSTCRELSSLSQEARTLASRLAGNSDDNEAKRELAQVEDKINQAAAKLWGLTDAELDEIRKALDLLK